MQPCTILSIIILVGTLDAKNVKPRATATKCGTSFCDADMFKVNAPIGSWHVPNLNNFGAGTWGATKVNYGKVVTTRPAGTSIVKYGGFCSGVAKTAAFLGSIAPVGIPDPSWISNIPAGDLDAAGNFKQGASYKIDVRLSDIQTVNQIASMCQNACASTVGCKYTSYGWEYPPGGWFCKFYTADVCSSTTTMFWSPAAPAFSVSTVGGSNVELSGFGGGCRMTDTISQDTPFLSPGTSLAVAPSTSFTANLPYVQTASYSRADGVIASIRCDVTEAGVSPGEPTFGTVWI